MDIFIHINAHMKGLQIATAVWIFIYIWKMNDTSIWGINILAQVNKKMNRQAEVIKNLLEDLWIQKRNLTFPKNRYAILNYQRVA